MRGEAPIASHLLFTQPGILDDADPMERTMGINAGLAWGGVADATVVYLDRGVSNGMRYGVDNAKRAQRPIEYRSVRPPAGWTATTYAMVIAARGGLPTT